MRLTGTTKRNNQKTAGLVGCAFGRLLTLSLAGLVPILAATGLVQLLFHSTSDEKLRLDELRFNQFGYVFIGLAAGCVAFDRFFGFSTNWMRYIGAAMRIETARIKFRFDWEHLIAPLKGNEPSDDQVRDILVVIQRFSLAIREAVEQETGAWITEFQTNLSRLDNETKALFEAAHKEKQSIDRRTHGRGMERRHPTSSIEVRLANFKLAGSEWAVAVDDVIRQASIRTESVLLKPVEPGHYKISATAHTDAGDLQASQTIEVRAGKLCKLSLTLE
jgi:hypothetical protein